MRRYVVAALAASLALGRAVAEDHSEGLLQGNIHVSSQRVSLTVQTGVPA